MRSNALKRFLNRLGRVQLYDTTDISGPLRSSLDIVIYAVMFGMLSATITGGAAWTGFQREVLGANDLELGLITAVPIAANVLQIIFSFYMEKKRNRRFVFLFFGIIARCLWIVIGLLPYLIPAHAHNLRIACTIALVVLISGGNSFVNIGFWSLMGDLVPMRIRGQFFSARQKAALAAGVLASLLASILIDRMGTSAYSLVLVFAGITGVADLVCYLFFKWPPMAEPKIDEKQESSLSMLKSAFQNKHFMTLCIVITCWQFSVGLSNPFNNVYLIEVMKLSFLEISLTTQIVSNIATVVSVSIWGRMIDRYGNIPVMRFVGSIAMLISGMWLFMKPGQIWLVILYHLLSGIFWISLDMGQQNLSLALSPQKNRSVYVAVFFAMINLFGIALGNALGGLLVQGPFKAMADAGALTLFGITLNRYHYIFLLSTLLRVIVMLFLIPKVNEQGAHSIKSMLLSQMESTRTKIHLWRRMILVQRIRRRIKRQNNQESE